MLSVCLDYEPMPAINVHFLKKEGSSQLYGLFLSTGSRKMMEGKDYDILDMKFLFIVGMLTCEPDMPLKLR